MINSTMALVVSQQVSYSFGFHTFFFFLVNGNFLFSPFSHLVNNPTAGQDSLNTLTSPKTPILCSPFPI